LAPSASDLSTSNCQGWTPSPIAKALTVARVGSRPFMVLFIVRCGGAPTLLERAFSLSPWRSSSSRTRRRKTSCRTDLGSFFDLDTPEKCLKSPLATRRLQVKRRCARLCPCMDYELVWSRFMADQRSFRSLEGLTGVPEETIRDLKRGRIKSPRLDTLRQLAKVYGQRRKAA
jgi:hypothetical protein